MNGKSQIIFSAVQPSGELTLGNYLGAVKSWVKLQSDYNCIFALADLHTITVRQDPKEFYDRIFKTYAWFLACGINPSESVFFIQSQVHTHTELGWILSCYTQFGELSRMTQFKDKSRQHSEDVNAGLFCYPSLMAADILLYNANLVPVGADQKQHLELTRNIAERFNGIYGETFVVPEPYIPKMGARVMSLQDPTKKMSKSDPNLNSCVRLMDDEATIIKKFKRAVTDSDSVVKYKNQGSGIDNLINIYCAVTGKSVLEVEKEFDGKGYGDFKKSVGEAVVEEIRPIQEKFKEYVKNPDYINSCAEKSKQKALEISEKTLNSVKSKVGFRI